MKKNLLFLIAMLLAGFVSVASSEAEPKDQDWECITSSECNDGNSCTQDTCKMTTKSCMHAPIPNCSPSGSSDSGDDKAKNPVIHFPKKEVKINITGGAVKTILDSHKDEMSGDSSSVPEVKNDDEMSGDSSSVPEVKNDDEMNSAVPGAVGPNGSKTRKASLQVKYVTPASGGTVLPNAQVRYRFNKEHMNLSSIENSFGFKKTSLIATTDVAIDPNELMPVSGFNSDMFSYVPNEPLTPATVYIATIKGGESGVKDYFGNTLQSDYTWSFATSKIYCGKDYTYAPSAKNSACAAKIGTSFNGKEVDYAHDCVLDQGKLAEELQENAEKVKNAITCLKNQKLQPGKLTTWGTKNADDSVTMSYKCSDNDLSTTASYKFPYAFKELLCAPGWKYSKSDMTPYEGNFDLFTYYECVQEAPKFLHDPSNGCDSSGGPNNVKLFNATEAPDGETTFCCAMLK